MIIDIVDLTDEQYANLNPVQLAMVRAAQSRKNAIVLKQEEDVRTCRHLAVLNGIGRASVVQFELQEIEARAEEEIERVKDDLAYQLAYESLGQEGNEMGPYRYPENPNYNLTPSQRFLVVRNYYMEVTSDPAARLQAFTMDTLARSYLGEFYQTLYDLFAKDV